MATTTQRLTALEAWKTAHDAKHTANPLHAATHTHPYAATTHTHTAPVPPPVEPPPPPPPPTTYSTLAAAITATPTGGSVNLTGQTFAAGATIAKAITIIGGAVKGQITVTASGVHLDGLDVSGGNKGIQYEGGAAGLANFSVKNCHVHDCVYAGIRILSGSQGVISGNTVERIGVGGALAANAYGIVLEAIAGTANHPQSHDITISNNTVRDVPTWHGIDTHGGYNLQIKGNTVTGCCSAIWLVPNGLSSSGGVQSNPHHIVVDGNTLSSPPAAGCNSRNAIFAWFLEDSQITNNKGTGWGSGAYTPPGYRDNGSCVRITASGNTMS